MRKIKSRHRRIEDVCWCICHMEGINVKHTSPCCEHIYKKYLDKNGNMIMEKAEKIFKNKKDKS